MASRLSNLLLFYPTVFFLLLSGFLVFDTYFKQETVSFSIMMETGQRADVVVILSRPSKAKVNLRYLVRAEAIEKRKINKLIKGLLIDLKDQGYFVKSITITPNSRIR